MSPQTLRPSTGYTIGRGKAKVFSAWRSLPLSNRVAKQSDGSRLIAAVKVIHNLARAVPEKFHPTEMFRVVRTYPNTVVLSGFKRDDQKQLARQLFSGGAVFHSKSAIHSLILVARCAHWVTINIDTRWLSR